MAEYLLTMEDISKSFPGVRALQGARLALRRGTVHALMGENGAGKSTLMKCLFGVYQKDSGKITLEGREINFTSSKEALEGGVAMVHQELNLAEVRSISENMYLGRYPRIWRGLPFISGRQMRRMTKELLREVSLDIDPDTKVSTLSISKRQMLEIARAISYDAKVIVFDEPTSSLTGAESEVLFGIIEMLKSRGVGIIYISHKMEEILRIADDVTIMRDGRHIATRPADELTTDEIIRLMVGRELKERYPVWERKASNELLRVEGLSGKNTHIRDISFSLRLGEVLGIAGLDGAGRTELLETLYGLRERQSGKILLEGKEVQNRSAREAINEGFALVSEDRRGSGIFGILSILENTVISSLAEHSRFGWLSQKSMRGAARRYIKRLRIKTPSEKTKISTLSGGNQQKVIFARWLLTNPKVLLLDEPTRGIDVLAKYEIYELIGELSQDGRGIIIVSSEMPELMGICDRILVLSAGRAAGEVTRGAAEEQIMKLYTKHLEEKAE